MLTDLGVPPEEIARVHRPIGLNIGSRIPPEIAVSTLAGLLADRNAAPADSNSNPAPLLGHKTARFARLQRIAGHSICRPPGPRGSRTRLTAR